MLLCQLVDNLRGICVEWVIYVSEGLKLKLTKNSARPYPRSPVPEECVKDPLFYDGKTQKRGDTCSR